jgi:hypothetical protein
MQSSLDRRPRRLLATLAVAAGLVVVPAVAPHSPVVDQAAAACRNARVAGTTKCLGPGQFCATRNQKDYRRAGFKCAPGSDGRNRLRKL